MFVITAGGAVSFHNKNKEAQSRSVQKSKLSQDRLQRCSEFNYCSEEFSRSSSIYWVTE